jgi:hypothetical protein
MITLCRQYLVCCCESALNERFAPQLPTNCESVMRLHAFQEKSKKGIDTPKYDDDLIKQRYKEAKELAGHQKDNEEA